MDLSKTLKKDEDDVKEGNKGDHKCLSFSPQLLSTEDVSGAEEGDAGEPQVLVQHEHTYWDEVRVAQVVDEAADVAIVAGVDTIHLPILQKHKTKHKMCQKLIGIQTYCA